MDQTTVLPIMHRKILFKSIPSHEMVENKELKKHRKLSVTAQSQEFNGSVYRFPCSVLTI